MQTAKVLVRSVKEGMSEYCSIRFDYVRGVLNVRVLYETVSE